MDDGSVDRAESMDSLGFGYHHVRPNLWKCEEDDDPMGSTCQWQHEGGKRRGDRVTSDEDPRAGVVPVRLGSGLGYVAL